ncbi:MAG TPA: HAMP domain-containing sensor histidine kinase [Gemmatimonadales bacterium]|nr:HAMP domain-containing sensor histidine kinase [Gemmatimonadales bacterium]
MPTNGVYTQEVLRQGEVALAGRVVTLWEISEQSEAKALLNSHGRPTPAGSLLDLDDTLRQWGAPIIAHSRWVGCRLPDGGRWCIAPVRTRPAAPPPRGVERRSRDRLILELVGLSLGMLHASDAAARSRLPPADALWELARQPSVIAHEVGNPLAVALGHVDLIADGIREAALDPGFRAQMLEDLAHVSKGIEQAADYLRSIQDRPFGGVARLARFDIVPVLRSCVTLERPLARKHGVALEWHTAVEGVYLYGDPSALYQVMTNLIRNAVDASEGRADRVTIGLSHKDDTVILAVRDKGHGVVPGNLPKIFEPGFTTKPPGRGSGIGLAVVKEITENMFGGKVSVETAVNVGSTFRVVLPIPPQRR